MTRALAIGVVLSAAFAPSTLVAQRSGGSDGFAPLDSLFPPPALAAPVTLRRSGVPLRTVIADIAKDVNVTIVFDPALAGLDQRVSVSADAVPAARVLLRLLGGSSIQAMASPTGSVVLVARARSEESINNRIAGTVGRIDGPLFGVRLYLDGTRFETSSDPSGKFSFGNVPAGTYMLRGVRMGYAPVRQPLIVAEGIRTPSVDLTMTPAAVPVDAVIVTPGYYSVMQPGMATAQALTRQQIETVPQLGEDVYRAVGRLPGVATTDFSAKFSVRGEPSEELAVTFDGLPLIEPYHLKDIGSGLSIIDMASLGGAELITGGTSAEYGDQLAGVFRMQSIDPRRDVVRASAGLSLTNVRGMAEGGFADGKGGWLLSIRRGYLDLAFKLANIVDSIDPQYGDVFAKMTYDLPHGGQLAAHVLHSTDRLHYLGKGDPRIDSHYSSDYAWTTLDGKLGSHLRQESVAWIGRMGWQRFGDQFNGTTRIAGITDERSLNTMGLRQDWSVDMGSRALFKVGADVRHETADYDYHRYLSQNDIATKQIVAVVDSTNIAIRPASDLAGVYVSQRVRPVDAITLEAGARYDHASHTGDAVVSPRVNGSWQPTTNTAVRASWGNYAQTESVFDLQVEDGVTRFAPAERATQRVVGVEQVLWNGLAARAEAYDRKLTDVRSQYVNSSSAIPAFPEIAYDRILVSPTRARSRGVEFSLVQESGSTVDWSASYVVSSSTQEVNGAWIPRVNDQPRALHAEFSYHPTSNAWRFTVSELWHSGFAYTPDVIRFDTLTTAQGTPFIYTTWRSGSLYSDRVPAYQRVDARWTRFINTHSGRLMLFIEVYNLFNTTNIRDHYLSANVNRLVVSTYQGDRAQLPRIPSFGISWEF